MANGGSILSSFNEDVSLRFSLQLALLGSSSVDQIGTRNPRSRAAHQLQRGDWKRSTGPKTLPLQSVLPTAATIGDSWSSASSRQKAPRANKFSTQSKKKRAGEKILAKRQDALKLRKKSGHGRRTQLGLMESRQRLNIETEEARMRAFSICWLSPAPSSALGSLSGNRVALSGRRRRELAAAQRRAGLPNPAAAAVVIRGKWLLEDLQRCEDFARAALAKEAAVACEAQRDHLRSLLYYNCALSLVESISEDFAARLDKAESEERLRLLEAGRLHREALQQRMLSSRVEVLMRAERQSRLLILREEKFCLAEVQLNIIHQRCFCQAGLGC
jgi:hypothetical protein